MRGDVAMGALALGSRERGGFSDSQIELLKTFAEQAVIAITQRRDVSRVANPHSRSSGIAGIPDGDQRRAEGISRAAYDLDTVLTMLLVTAERLCGANRGQIWRKDGETFRYAAGHINVHRLIGKRKSKQRLGLAEGR